MGGAVGYVIKTLLWGLLCALLGACVTSNFPSAAGVCNYRGQPTGGASGPLLDELAAQVPDAASADTFCADFDAPYARVFSTTVKYLNEQGDAVRLADNDIGYIATNASQHWPMFRDSYSLQYFIVFEKVSPTRIRILFKVLQWELAFGPTDNVQRNPIGAALSADSEVQQANANQFVSRLRTRIE